MYYPYFRGKQFELLAVRELAPLMAAANFVPIIEPVRESLTGLRRSLDAIKDKGGRAFVVTNPRHGHFSDDRGTIKSLTDSYQESGSILPGVILHSDLDTDEAVHLTQNVQEGGAIIHDGFTDGRAIKDHLAGHRGHLTNIFQDRQVGLLYRSQFQNMESKLVILQDGFNQQRNADYPAVELFSDLHATYQDRGLSGYGDYLTVGNQYTEGGGPAYAVAIHLTYIDRAGLNEMQVLHFKSDSNDTPTDPAGKFAQALTKLADYVTSQESQVTRTSAVEEFLDLHQRRHFPGLGYVKKLSMKHHVETLAQFHGSSS
ncbi:sce7725 family protein [Nesterenkonia sp. F]|uniref:sce7725 family protein n=1 Tax=Nesterenkonia sp. F TaxID=795955 RepID=UPI000A07B0C3|nr:sce7725 family protein [Nesterenkonia sp. F]